MLPVVAMVFGMLRNQRRNGKLVQVPTRKEMKQDETRCQGHGHGKHKKRCKTHVHWERVVLILLTLFVIPLLAFKWKAVRWMYIQYFTPK